MNAHETRRGWAPIGHWLLFLPFLLFVDTLHSSAQGFLKASGKYIVNGKGEKVLLRGIGLGGWMLQEGYMLKLEGEGQQYRIREKLEDLVGKEETGRFYDLWLSNHTCKADIDSIKAWGFNSVRLPMHYNLFTLPVEEEQAPGQQTWLEKGFALTDSLLSWCSANGIYLILDLHAAPGGQGNDLNISDRDPSKPSLWESRENQQKLLALWSKLSKRYANEPWIGGYDILNEPNWGFDNPEDRNGLKEEKNVPLKVLLIQITKAIRGQDKNHLIIIEGNGWDTNYKGIEPTWDDNLVVSFHKYWNYNNNGSIRQYLEMREKYNVPIYLGESGENSNVWFTEAVRLMESNNVGWAWWPLKKVGANNPLEIITPPYYENLLNYWNKKGPKPPGEEVKKVLKQLAANTKLERCIFHKDVIDALFRQVYSPEAVPFQTHVVDKHMVIKAVDYDLGGSGIAYYDMDSADYHNSTGKEWTTWNTGRAYRNDAVDIKYDKGISDGYYITDILRGEWLQYTFRVIKEGSYMVKITMRPKQQNADISMIINSRDTRSVRITKRSNHPDWDNTTVQNVLFKDGDNTLRLLFLNGNIDLKSIELIRSSH